MKIGSRISQLRHELGWSQYQLAQRLGTNTKTVKDWESEVSSPSVVNLVKLCQAFHTSADEMLGLSGRSVLTLDNLSPADQKKVRAVLQVLIDLTDAENE